ncbi:endonuclease domain-containing protein [Arthrobacter russicus]|uniref:Very-short-patch-repair endonuclease n=1 Tax=Arthrobacter russicus TaxID=172040 RepID=A0ABU1JD90_9MICC|nr:DUF559 domain-containing protein [Arthrobacter russicus]MDR6270394.1 very-short-patch-repair endonuclease [Arthrobacter russicus]
MGRWAELQRVGVTRFELNQALARRDVHRPFRAIYQLPGADPQDLLRAEFSASFGCISAAGVHGLWVWKKPVKPHLSASRALCSDGRFVVHRSRDRQPRVVEVAECVRQAIGCLPELEALVVAESALVLGKMSPAELRDIAQKTKSAKARRVTRQVELTSQSLIETIARQSLRAAGFQVECQYRIEGVGRVDLWLEGKLAIELDGRQFHSGEAEFLEDRRRWNELTLRGIPLLRFPAKLVLNSPERLVSIVTSWLANQG